MADKPITDPNIINQIVNEISNAVKVGSSTFYLLPKQIIQLQKLNSGNKIFTITLCKIANIRELHFYYFELFTKSLWPGNHNLNGMVKICYSPGGDTNTNFASWCTGSISNVRVIQSEGIRYIGADILVQQYGGCYIDIIGFHEDATQIKDVTDNFSEVES